MIIGSDPAWGSVLAASCCSIEPVREGQAASVCETGLTRRGRVSVSCQTFGREPRQTALGSMRVACSSFTLSFVSTLPVRQHR